MYSWKESLKFNYKIIFILDLPPNIEKTRDNDGSTISDEISQTNQNKNPIMKRQDFFIWQSTVERYVSLRDKIDGSPFTKALALLKIIKLKKRIF